jgi:hypothetical protein
VARQKGENTAEIRTRLRGSQSVQKKNTAAKTANLTREFPVFYFLINHLRARKIGSCKTKTHSNASNIVNSPLFRGWYGFGSFFKQFKKVSLSQIICA